MNDRILSAYRQSENGDRFGASCYRATPRSIDQAKNRRDQGPGMTDSNPNHEVRDIETPENRSRDSRYAHPLIHLICVDKHTGKPDGYQDEYKYVVTPRRMEHR